MYAMANEKPEKNDWVRCAYSAKYTTFSPALAKAADDEARWKKFYLDF